MAPRGGILSDEDARFLSDRLNELEKRMDVVQGNRRGSTPVRDDFYIAFPTEAIPKATLDSDEITLDPKDAKIFRFKAGSTTVMEQLPELHKVYNPSLDADLAVDKPVPVHREWRSGKFFAFAAASSGGGGGPGATLCSLISAVPGYNGSKTQAVGHVEGDCQMLDVTDFCDP